MRPRTEEGGFIEPFDPLELKGFCEGNSWGYTFYVPHDIEGLAGLMGGCGKMVEKLDDAFKKAGDMKYYAPKPKLERNRAYINYGNENTRFTAFVFNHAGRPDLTQKWSRKVYEKLFSSISLRSFCEDDDCGLAAGTGVLLALGLFDIKGGAYEKPVYELGSPVFDRVAVKLCEKYYPGGEFIMEIQKNSHSSPYVKSVVLNKKPIKGPIPHEEVVKGGILEIEMTGSPPALT
jgi:putative alpha-1,2-mannosidase